MFQYQKFLCKICVLQAVQPSHLWKSSVLIKLLFANNSAKDALLFKYSQNIVESLSNFL